MNIMQMSLQGALMIAVIVIVRALGMGKLPKWSFQALWGVAIARLLIPFQIESKLSVYGALDRAREVFEPAPQVIQAVTNTAGYTAAPTAAALSTPLIMGNATAAAAPAAPPISPWFAMWAAGAVLLLGYFLLTHLRCRRTYAQALPLSTCKVNGMNVAVRVSDRITAPLTYGIARPVVLLPKRLGANAYDYVLAHELAHVRHLDTLKKWLLTLALCAHWFNPMVWVMFILATRDIELMCDESVVRGFGDGAKASYATMLIDLMEERGGLVPLASHFSRNAIEERIIAIMKHKKASRAAIVTAAALVITTATALSTNAVTVAVEGGSASPVPPTGSYIVAQVAQADESHYDQTDYVELYAPYAAYGLTYNPENGRLYYKGELVRFFEDMYPVGDGGSAGSVMQRRDGTVDVHGVRDLTQLTRNPDGSYDPSGKLIGVEPYTQAEFDARTKRWAEADATRNTRVSSGNVTVATQNSTHIMEGAESEGAEEVPNIAGTSENETDWWYNAKTGQWYNARTGQWYEVDGSVMDAASAPAAAQGIMHIWEGVESATDTIEVPNLVGTSMDDIEWWTAEEYEAWLNEQREELPKRIGERAYMGQRGWFVWTQEDVDDALAMYESILNGIKSGVRVSKSVGGRDDFGVSFSDSTTFEVTNEASFEVTTEAKEDIDVVVEGPDDAPSLGSGHTFDAYARSAWKMDYDALTLHSVAWRGRVFLCDGIVTEVTTNAREQTVVMDVNLSGVGEPQYVILTNYSSAGTPEIGGRYTAYADVTGNQFYGNKNCPTLACRYMIKQ